MIKTKIVDTLLKIELNIIIFTNYALTNLYALWVNGLVVVVVFFF